MMQNGLSTTMFLSLWMVSSKAAFCTFQKDKQMKHISATPFNDISKDLAISLPKSIMDYINAKLPSIHNIQVRKYTEVEQQQLPNTYSVTILIQFILYFCNLLIKLGKVKGWGYVSEILIDYYIKLHPDTGILHWRYTRRFQLELFFQRDS